MNYWGVIAPKECDLCQTEIKTVFVDGATASGPWANMCLPCHSQFGRGLGVGKGQKYVLQIEGNWLKENSNESNF